MRIFKKIGKPALFSLLAMVFLGIWNEAYTTAAFSRLMMHDLYTQKENVDLFFVGASHTYRSFDPAVFDEELQVNSFNLGTSSQTYEGGYFLVKEALKKHNPKCVIVEITYALLEDVYERQKLADYILLDYMKPGTNKWDYVKSAFDTEEWADVFIPCYRNRILKNPYTALKNLLDKGRRGYFQYKDTQLLREGKLLEAYEGKGFVYREDCFGTENEIVVDPYPWDAEKVNKEKIGWLRKITQLCRENGIDVLWVTAPISQAAIRTMGNYEEAHSYIEKLAEQEKVEYYDFNYYKEAFLPKNDALYFYDASHMNGAYAEMFSREVVKLLMERAEGKTGLKRAYFETE